MIKTLTDLLRERADKTDAASFRFLQGGVVKDSFSYAELDASARGVAARLASEGAKAGDLALLIYPPGLDFVRALFGCFYAGVTAVPVYPPNPARLARTLPRLRAVASDSGAGFVLTTAEILEVSEAMFPLAPEVASAAWIATDDGKSDPSAWKAPAQKDTDLAILQYTSGSTREPRGVMLTHANVLHNQGLIQEGFAHGPGEHTVVSWLPVYHDMGLIGMTLQPVFLGGSCVMMAPLEFLQSPIAWLDAVTKYRATTTGAPNFAYELCSRKITDAQLADLDLSSWRVAYCGAEPIRKDTLDRFAARMAPAGFRSSSLLPCYGLAEGTLIVSGTSREEGAVAVSADEAALREGRIVPSTAKDKTTSLVGCGRVLGDQELAIVKGGARCEAGTVGEIWVSGGSVAVGYWNQPEETRAVFGAEIAGEGRRYLRTGDLGVLDESGELFVVGRVKDLLIVRGLNYYPHDLEASVEAAWPALRPGCSVAFALDGDDREEVALVCEYQARALREGVTWEPVIDAIRSAIAAEHELALRAIIVVAPGQVPKTPSGKVQRSETRRRHLAGELEVLHAWVAKDAIPEIAADVAMTTADDIAAFLTSWLSERLGRPISREASFAAIGLDSLDGVRLTTALGERLGRELNPMLAIDFPSVGSLAEHLASPVEG